VSVIPRSRTLTYYPRGDVPPKPAPIRLFRRIEPFDSDQFIFELKVDGFRALTHIEDVVTHDK